MVSFSTHTCFGISLHVTLCCETNDGRRRLAPVVLLLFVFLLSAARVGNVASIIYFILSKSVSVARVGKPSSVLEFKF